MLSENPYYHRGPIREPEYFYDRLQETGHALQMLENRQSVSVVGPRRIGKTSFLFHLADPIVRSKSGLCLERRSFVYLDGEALGGLSQPDILRLMLRETVIQCGVEKGDVFQPVDFYAFAQALRELIGPKQHLVYLIDEFEYLSQNKNLDAHFFPLLRSLTVHHSIVTSSQEPLSTLVPGHQPGSHFFNVFEPIHLGLFRDPDARQMVREPSLAAGTEFPQHVEDLLLAWVGPHPFFLQIACFHAVELARQDPAFGEQTLGELYSRIEADVEGHFGYFVEGLSEPERRVVAGLLGGGQVTNSPEVLEALGQKCLVRRVYSEYQFVSQCFADFARRHIGAAWTAAVAEGERRMATVLYADVVRFTPMTEQHTPEEMLSIIKSAMKTFVDVIDINKGKIATFGGDSVMALFGVPEERPDDAVRAVRAALEIQAWVAQYARELEERMGINFSTRVGLDTGVVAVGEIGGEQRAEFTAYGDAINLAQRMQSHAEPGTVLISDRTYRQVGSRFRTKSLGPIEVKGKSQPVKAYQVLGEREI